VALEGRLAVEHVGVKVDLEWWSWLGRFEAVVVVG
jgi:hypothetical protein